MTYEPEPADAVALLTAHLNGDENAVTTMLDLIGPMPLFAVTVGFLVELIGPEDLQHALDRWREARLQ